MKKKLLLTMLVIGNLSYAEYTIRFDISDKIKMTNTPIVNPPAEEWVVTTPIYSNYTITKTAYDCQNWTPAPNTIIIDSTIQQSSSNCKVDQERLVYNQERNTVSGEVRSVGSPITEKNTLTNGFANRMYTVSFGEWNLNDSNCENWSPDPLSLPASPTNITEQTRTCTENRTRVRNESFVSNETDQIILLPTINEIDSISNTTSRNIYEDFFCDGYTGDSWKGYLVFKDGSGEFGIDDDTIFTNKNTREVESILRKGTEYIEGLNDSSIYIFYKGNFMSTITYTGKAADMYQICTRNFHLII